MNRGNITYCDTNNARYKMHRSTNKITESARINKKHNLHVQNLRGVIRKLR